LYDLWHWRRKHKPRVLQTILAPLAEFFRIWDRAVDANVDYYFVNSPIIKQRLWKYYKRDGVVLYPPVERGKYKFKEYGDFYLHIGRFDPEKRIRLAVDACLKTKRKLILIGIEGRDKETFKYVKRLSETSPYIEYLGHVSDNEKRKLLSECRAVIYPPIAEDFGIVPIEALVSGKPVIVTDSGFPRLLVEQYHCGVITKPTIDDMIRAIHQLEQQEWNPDQLRERAKQFDFSVFKSQLHYWLNKWYKEFNERLGGKI
jgi:glycosyltransferase involved in cell wall biosynthesis